MIRNMTFYYEIMKINFMLSPVVPDLTLSLILPILLISSALAHTILLFIYSDPCSRQKIIVFEELLIKGLIAFKGMKILHYFLYKKIN